jgi:hypothetical protein
MSIDLRHFLGVLSRHGELLRVADEVDLRYEVCEFLRQADRACGPALSFERVKGHSRKSSAISSAQKGAWRWPSACAAKTNCWRLIGSDAAPAPNRGALKTDRSKRSCCEAASKSI